MSALISANAIADEIVNPAVIDQTTSSQQLPSTDLSQLKYATPQLAISFIDQSQPSLSEYPNEWLIWEKKRLQLMAELTNWQAIIQRIDSYQINTPLQQRAWFILFKAGAQNKIAQSQRVRTGIGQLLWSDEYGLNSEQIATARRHIIRSYLIDANYDDAKRAMFRYRQDYGESGLEWKQLQAKVLLASGLTSEAVEVLAEENATSVTVLKYLSRLSAGMESPVAIYRSSLRKIKQKGEDALSETDKRQYWILAYVAAGLANYTMNGIGALERGLITGTADTDNDVKKIDANLLWQKYIDYAQLMANKKQLLIGDHETWFKLAERYVEKKPIKSRALWAAIGTQTDDAEVKEKALLLLTDSILKTKTLGLPLIKELFLNNQFYPTADTVPLKIRYLLLDAALSLGAIKQAAQLFSFLPEPPAGEKRLDWDLRRARVMVLGGEYDIADVSLNKIIANEKFTPDSLNKLMQVIFDFQKAGQHQQAIILFQTLAKRIKVAAFRREVNFWIAESYQALKEYTTAAQFYLTSAYLIKEKENDPWAQTARFRSAEVLIEAGFIIDAKQLFNDLLKYEKNKNRRSAIQQNLQQIWLLEGKQAQHIE